MGKIFVLVEFDVAVVVDGVAYDECGSGVEAGCEVIDKGGALVENHVEAQAVVLQLVVVDRQPIVLVKHDRR